jgi:TRAP-type uncharacterized transport system substrate-binding protein
MKSNSFSRGRRTALAGAGLGFLEMMLGPGSALAQELRKFRILMTPEQSGVYHAYAIMQARSEENHPWLRPIAVETGGFNYNVNYIAKNPEKWTDTMLGSATVLEWAAQRGIQPFYPEPLSAVGDLRVIGGMGGTGNFWVTLDPDIRTPNDFAGKRVSTGLLSQNEWGMYPKMLLDGWGITPKLKSFSALGPGKNIDALLDGKVQAAMMVSFFREDMREISLAAPFNQLLASNRPFYYVNVPPEMIRAYNQKTGAAFSIREFKANALAKQTQAFTTFGNEMTVSAHKTFPEDLAYEFAKLWVKMGPVVAKYNSLGKLWTPEGIAGPVRSDPARAHPGALRAYKELGLLA